ncbi:MAG: hypothetical protein M9907_08645 [Burkholderiaceae bacterium]|nr:hypothetical protein [Burkholderiaceae bacterium]
MSPVTFEFPIDERGEPRPALAEQVDLLLRRLVVSQVITGGKADDLRLQFAESPRGTAGRIIDLVERVDRCDRCAFLRRPASGRSFCAGRGSAFELPADRGAWCAGFRPRGDRP